MKQTLLLLLSFTIVQLFAQEQLEVKRCADIDRLVPIDNIFVDRDNNKWVADAQGLFLAQSPDFAKTIAPKSDQWTLLSAPDGNEELYFPKSKLEEIIGMSVTQITTARSDGRKKELWIGTAEKGLFHLNTKGGLALIKNLTSSNSKLRSNTIQTLFITASGKVLAATDDGLFSSNGKKENLYSKGYDFTAIANNKGTIWVIADGEVLEMDNKGGLYESSFDDRMFDGTPVDIDFDKQGNLWIASESIVRYHFDTEAFDLFGPAEDFTSQSVKCIAADSDGALWVGTQNKGVFYIGKSSSLNGSLAVTEFLDCKSGAKNAELEVRATGGTPPYTYEWTQGLKGENPKGLGPGDYAVTISDQNGKKATAQITIIESKFTLEVRALKEAAMEGGKDGSAIVEIKGAKQVAYLWDNGETTATATQLTAGEHSVTVSENNGCSIIKTVVVKEKLGTLSVSLEQREMNDCAGDKNASLSAKVTGGQDPYTYQWMGASGFSKSADNLGAGKYTVVITDANNNTTVGEATIKELSKIKATIKVKSPATANNADGKAVVKAEGGTGKQYKYKWDTGETEATATALALGLRSVTVTDEKGCTAIASVEISENILPLSAKINNTNTINCFGDSDATLVAEVDGGKLPYTYKWSGASTNGEKADGLAAGDYQLTITDAVSNTAVAKITIKSPKELSLKIKAKSPATVNNADGKATAEVSGGSGKKYKYNWDTGETTATAIKLSLGTHSLTVTDKNGCSTSATIEITEDVLPLSLSLDNTSSIKCAGQATAALKANIEGGKPPFTYEWSDSKITGDAAANLVEGSYALTITDAAGTTAAGNAKIEAPAPVELTVKVSAPATTNNADGKAKAIVNGGTGKYSYNWDNNEITLEAAKLSPGKHQLTVTDDNGCSTTTEVEIMEDILPLAVSIKQSASIKCNNEKTAALEVVVQGGKTPFTYKWNEAGISGAKATQLGGGTYELTLTDASGLSQTTTILIEEPAKLSIELAKNTPATNENSRDGKASLKISGGTLPYAFNWDTKETASEAVKLPVGEHSVTVSDANGCSANLKVKTGKKILPALTAGRLKQGQTLQVSNLYFDADSTNMTAASYPTLNEIASFLKDNPLVVIEVGGHTNNLPKAEFCDVLSTARAKSVAAFIVKKGIDQTRVLYKGYGKREPKYSNNHKEGRAKNQRVEIKILSLQ